MHVVVAWQPRRSAAPPRPRRPVPPPGTSGLASLREGPQAGLASADKQRSLSLLPGLQVSGTGPSMVASAVQLYVLSIHVQSLQE